MSDNFLQLPLPEQAQILSELSQRFGRSPTILEKDIWICWALKQLFSMPGHLQMAFKGGTSLSKVFNVIQRFSEDVDVTIDYRNFNENFDPFSKVSKTQIKKFNERLKIYVKHYTHEKVIPYLKLQLQEQFSTKIFKIEGNEKGEEVYLYYPSAVQDINNYVLNRVLFEFGGRNITEPSTIHDIQPDIAEALPGLIFPIAKVNVLSATRTFWEKATLIHAACNQGVWKDSLEKKSRHWYDLAMLAKSSLGEQALLDRKTFADVVQHKNIFFHSPYADYSSCLIGKMKLIPQSEHMLEGLKSDLEEMVKAGMFYKRKAPVFEEIIYCLTLLEQVINNSSTID